MVATADVTDADVMSVSDNAVPCVACSAVLVPPVTRGSEIESVPPGSGVLRTRLAMTRPGRANFSNSLTSQIGGTNSPPTPSVVLSARAAWATCSSLRRRRSADSRRP